VHSLVTPARFLQPVAFGRQIAEAQRPKPELLDDFRDDDIRRTRLADASDFGEKIFELLSLLVPGDRLRHLVV
jgi:hypothetical protein